MISDREILSHIERQARHTAGFKQLVRELGVHGAERKEFARRLEKLVARGALLEIDSEKYALPQSLAARNALIGRLTMHRDGYGFVIPERAGDEGKKGKEPPANLVGDIFIPPPALASAMHGDRVLVAMGPVRPDGRAEGRILRVLSRAHPTVVGIFHYCQRYVTDTATRITIACSEKRRAD